VLEFIGFIICTWLAAGFLALVFDWIEGFPKALGNRKSITKSMKIIEKYNNTKPKITIVTFAVCVFVFSGPFSFFMSEIRYDFEN